MPKKIAIITGASAGLGKEFAVQLKKKINSQSTKKNYPIDEVWLIARRENALKALAEELKPLSCRILPYDLNDSQSFSKIESELKSGSVQVFLLINNAGLGKLGKIEDLSLEDQIQTVNLNVIALMSMTKICLPFMSKGSVIMQVASTASFAPIPYFATYAATKVFVLNWSKALQFEVKGRGIHVINVCPGPVETEFFAHATQSGGIWYNSYASSSQVVRKAYSDLESKRSLSVYGFTMSFYSIFAKFVPEFILSRILAKMHQV